jgi:hypothetical protein
MPEESAGAEPRADLHDNVRGGSYFDEAEHQHRRDDPKAGATFSSERWQRR